jgi:hypothetical protein
MFPIFSKLTRRRARLPSVRVAKDIAEAQRALWFGILWVNVPALAIFIANMMLAVFVVKGWYGGDPKGLPGVALLILVALISMIPAWLWWSVMIPRWLIWALRSGANLELLEALAVGHKLRWSTDTPMGRFFARTEWWTEALRREARAVLAARAASATN